jgi:hypothetical protein
VECRSEHVERERCVLGYCELIVSEHWNFNSVFIKYLNRSGNSFPSYLV